MEGCRKKKLLSDALIPLFIPKGDDDDDDIVIITHQLFSISILRRGIVPYGITVSDTHLRTTDGLIQCREGLV